MRRSAMLAVSLAILTAMTGCAGRAVDEELLPTRVPTLDPQALVRAAEVAQVEPDPTATDTPTLLPEPTVTETPVTPTPEPVPAATDTPLPPTDEPETVEQAAAEATAEPITSTVDTAPSEDVTATTVVTESEPVEAVDPRPAAIESEPITDTVSDSGVSPDAAGSSDTASTETVTDTVEAAEPAGSVLPEPTATTVPATAETTEGDAEIDPVLTGLPESLAAAIADADPDRGETLTLSVGCSGCHSLDPNQFMAGPTWYNLAEVAAQRVPGESAGLYLYHSIVDPNAYLVEGYLPNIMLQIYKDTLPEEDMADIIAYLLTLRSR